MSTTQLCRLSALELAEAIRSGQVSSREVVEAHLRRIEAVNPSITAVRMALGAQALEAAEAADRAVAAGGDLPLLYGVPVTSKANIDLAGTPTTHGLKALAGADPGLDAPVVERIRAAGTVPSGHTNLPSFGTSWHTDSELRGATVDSRDRSRTLGASSGGEARGAGHRHDPAGAGQ